MRIYVGNIPYQMTEDELRALFEPYGAVKETKIVTDRDTKLPRGFSFVTMATTEGGSEAINQLHQSNYGGRTIVVSVAKERQSGRAINGHNRERDWGA